MRVLNQPPRLLGYVHLRVGADVYAVPVQAVPFHRDDERSVPGGFFTEASGECGILVDSEASEGVIRKQIQAAISDAVSHVSRRVLN